ncbi:MAG: GNAT family N-acetyltransferase [Solirubrobacteraceae bacterium]
MSVRAATADDAAAIAAVFLAAAEESWGATGDDAPVMESLEIHGGEVVAEDDDGITGFAIIKDCGIDLLFTHPRAWGRGAGRALVVAAEDALREAGCSEVSLWTEERNASARRVYQASGWRKTTDARERVWNGAPLRELRYRKRL